jgi:hypothetical protein
MRRAWLVVTAGMLLVGSAAPGLGAQNVDPRLRARLDARTLSVVEQVIDSARAAGLPADPLVSRALEGASKRASGHMIVAAVRTLAADLGRARVALGSESAPDELGAGTEALRAGVTPEALRRLRHERRAESVAVPLGVLSDMVSSGVPVDVATKTVIELTRAGAADQLLVEFRRDVERDIGIGAPPATAATLQATRASFSLQTDGSVAAPPRAPAAPRRQRP